MLNSGAGWSWVSSVESGFVPGRRDVAYRLVKPGGQHRIVQRSRDCPTCPPAIAATGHVSAGSPFPELSGVTSLGRFTAVHGHRCSYVTPAKGSEHSQLNCSLPRRASPNSSNGVATTSVTEMVMRSRQLGGKRSSKVAHSGKSHVLLQLHGNGSRERMK